MRVGIGGPLRLVKKREVCLPHPAIPLEAGRRCAQMRSTGGMGVGERAAELLGRQRRWGDGDQAWLLEPRRTVIEHGHDGGTGVRGLGEPREPRNLVGDPPAATIRFPDGVHRHPSSRSPNHP